MGRAATGGRGLTPDVSGVTWRRVAGVLPFRLVGFLVAQVTIALVLTLQQHPDPWAGSLRWWPVAAVLTNLVTLVVVRSLVRAEGGRWRDLLTPDTTHLRRDLPVVLGLAVAAAVLVVLPSFALAVLLLGDADYPATVLFQPLPGWAATATLVLLPLTIALVELPVYFGYLLPRVELLSGRPWLAVGLTAGFFALQHATLPLVLDPAFVLYRALMYLPLGLLLALALRWRPRLLPYLALLHGVSELQAALMVVGA